MLSKLSIVSIYKIQEYMKDYMRPCSNGYPSKCHKSTYRLDFINEDIILIKIFYNKNMDSYHFKVD